LRGTDGTPFSVSLIFGMLKIWKEAFFTFSQIHYNVHLFITDTPAIWEYNKSVKNNTPMGIGGVWK
jgi:hypothetical protein